MNSLAAQNDVPLKLAYGIFTYEAPNIIRISLNSERYENRMANNNVYGSWRIDQCVVPHF